MDQKVNPEFIRELKRTVNTSPYPSHMKMSLTDIGVDRASIDIKLDRCHLQPYGIVHGGVIATIIDTATFWAGFLRLPERDGLVNVDLKLNYLQSVVSGTLRAEGVCLRHGRTLSYAEATVFDDREALIAHGTSSLMILPGKGLEMGIDKFLR